MKNYNLNTILPPIDRKSDSQDEGKYYDLLRFSPTPTVISGGQSGIDSMGLKSASDLGLPAFAIMPKNGRRENCSIEDFSKRESVILRKIELNSESYRFRTYANVYFADVTVIFDFVNKSEGTVATVDACNSLSRPYILLTDTTANSLNLLCEFLRLHKPQIINVAGNSLSKIDEKLQKNAYDTLYSALKDYCFFLKTPSPYIPKTASKQKLKIAIPNFSVCKKIFGNFFKESYGVNVDFSKKLTYDFDEFTLITARAREIINLVNLGVDVGFVGKDLTYEYDLKKSILLDSGLIPNSTVIVTNCPNLEESDFKLCSQYPNIAGYRLKNAPISPISGSAEAYLSLGIFNSTVDSYQTGATINENGLTVKEKLMETSLVMIGNDEIKNTDFYKKFVNYLTVFKTN
ncbi:MAG: hypothetical protein E7360_05080 [Clostridiales bacterium]|nr:hypothetical protein [Clostridiales bacterium]